MSTPSIDEIPIVVLAIKNFQSVVGRSRDHTGAIKVEVNSQDDVSVGGVWLLQSSISPVLCLLVFRGSYLDLESEIALIDGHDEAFRPLLI